MAPEDSREWALSQRVELSGGFVTWDRFGAGAPVVLVHGTPSWSYLWRRIVPTLAQRFTVYVWDLLGYGDSEQRDDQDISIAAQSRYLGELLDHWELTAPAVAGHDIGGAIVLRSHLCEKRAYRCLSLIDAVVFNPWNTPTTMHIRHHLDAYQTMPAHIYEQVVRAHLRTAVAKELPPEVLDAYFRPWSQVKGQRAYFRKLDQIDETQTAVLEPLLGTIGVPTQVLWGEEDHWLSPDLGARLKREIPNATLDMVPAAGHFAMEDNPAVVGTLLADFIERS